LNDFADYGKRKSLITKQLKCARRADVPRLSHRVRRGEIWDFAEVIDHSTPIASSISVELAGK
jgi:hypothetical protein